MTKLIQYKIGDFVKIKNFRARLNHSKSLEPKFLGPFKILRMLGDLNYELVNEKGKLEKVHYEPDEPHEPDENDDGNNDGLTKVILEFFDKNLNNNFTSVLFKFFKIYVYLMCIFDVFFSCSCS